MTKCKQWLKDHFPGCYIGWLRICYFMKNLLYSFAVVRFTSIQQNKIVFDNFKGKGFGCNPKYVTQKLIEKYPGQFELVWLVSKENIKDCCFPPQVRIVPYESIKAFREYATAKVWATNTHKIDFIQKGLYKRPKQCFIQMWHGSLGIKKVEKNAPRLLADKKWLEYVKISSRITDYWTSNSTFSTAVYKSAFWDVKDEIILPYGSPRNDLLLDELKMQKIRRKVKAFYGIAEQKIVLYVPTFRDDYRLDCYAVEFDGLRKHLGRRFGGDWVVLFRLHPRVRQYSKEIVQKTQGIIDATAYEDIQELLAAADCVLTDYSSCIYDFILTRRPGFLYVSDLEEYDTERGFYYPLETTPFPLARNNMELMENIDRFDERRYQDKVEAFLKDKGCIEDGHASERVADLIARLAGIS